MVQLLFPRNLPPMRIVGVVADMRNSSGAGWRRSTSALKEIAAPGLFVPASQGAPLATDFGWAAHWMVRSRTSPAATAAAVAGIMQDAEPRLPFVAFRTMDEVIGGEMAQARALFLLLAVFALVALVLACVGTYGMMAYSVSARSRDIGIRMACGATSSRILTAFLRESLVVLAAGVCAGLAGAVVLVSVLRAQIWGIAHFDLTTFATVVMVLAVVVLLATTAPARRPARAEPARALRGE